ncbi:MAG TPA: DUF4112 domain-containing protein [Vicinamibacterales bacterium]|jgi:hypothetical protein|nr:DUF4112 domain-containing protein [Vicinamibacterales bacterium]
MPSYRMVNDPDGLALMRRWARIFDSAFRIPGTQITFGIDPILGVFPGIGDLVSPVFSLFLLWHGARLRVPKIVLARMVLNAAIDAGVGAIPVVGDLFDFAWKANEWNLALLEKHAMPGQRASSVDWLFVIVCCMVVILIALIPILVLYALGMWLAGLRPGSGL